MNETLNQIRQYLENGYYENEENVRFSLVSRILLELGWNIWNPKEVATEFQAVPNEDSTRVDIALFDNPYTPTVYIETKAIGKLESNLSKYEIQLRDYNRNNTAPFSIITDGQKWRFYYSQTGGEFSQKCFRKIDILKDDIENVELTLFTFLSKEEISTGRAKKEAETYLQLTQKQRAMENAYSKAKKVILEPPFLSLPEALINIVENDGFPITKDEASNFIKKQTLKEPTKPQPSIIRIAQPTKITKNSHNKNESYTNTNISSFILKNNAYVIRTYKDMLLELCYILQSEHKQDFDKVLSIVGRKRPYFSKDRTTLRRPEQIKYSNIFVETNLSANNIVGICYNLINLFHYSKEDFSIVND